MGETPDFATIWEEKATGGPLERKIFFFSQKAGEKTPSTKGPGPTL